MVRIIGRAKRAVQTRCLTKISVKAESEVTKMAGKKVKVQMSKDRKYRSCTRYVLRANGANEVWEKIYAHNKTLEEIGNPDVVRVTLEAVSL